MTTVAKKELGLLALLTGVSALVVLVYVIFLPVAVEAWVVALFLALLVLVWQALWLMALSLGRRKAITAGLCVVPALIVVVISRFSPVAAGGALLLVVFSLLAARTLVRDEANRLYYRTTDFFTNAARLLALGVLITLTSLAWPILTDSIKNTRFTISERQVAPFLKPIEPVIQDFFPGYTATASIDDLINASLAEEKKNLPPGAVIDPVQEERMRQDVKRRLGGNITGNEGLAAVVAGKINRQINAMTSQNPLQASILLAVLAFLTLRALLPFVVWPTLVLVALLMKLAVALKLAQVRTENVTLERLRL